MSTMDWLTILFAAAGGLGGAGLAHGLSRGQIMALRLECDRMWDELRDLRARLDRQMNGNGSNHD